MSYSVQRGEITSVCPHCGQRNRVPAAHLSSQGKCGRCGAAFGPLAEPLAVDAAVLDAVVSQARVPVLVDFWAGWCAPCRMAAPHVDAAARATAGRAVALKVDTEAHPALAERFQVRGIPFFMVFRGGRPVLQQAGVVGAEQLQAWLRQAG